MDQKITIEETYALKELMNIAWPQKPGYGSNTYRDWIHRPKLTLTKEELLKLLPEEDVVRSSTGGEIDLNELNIKYKVEYNATLYPDLGEYKGTLDQIYYNQLRDLLELIIDKLGRYWLVIKIAEVLEERYAMSFGQAKAVVHKVIGSSLDDTTRSQLHKLRNKIRKYAPLVENFSFLLNDNDITGRMSVVKELNSE